MFRKDPDEVIDFGINWRENGYLEDGEDITDSSWEFSPSGLTITDETYDNLTGLCSFFAGGGADGTSYLCTNTIDTSMGRTYQKAIIILVEEISSEPYLLRITIPALVTKTRMYLRDPSAKRWKSDSDIEQFLADAATAWSTELPFSSTMSFVASGNEYYLPIDFVDMYMIEGSFTNASVTERIIPGGIGTGVWRTGEEPISVLVHYPTESKFYLPRAPLSDFVMYYGSLHSNLLETGYLSLPPSRAWGEMAVIAYACYLAHNPASAFRASMEQWADKQDLRVDNPLEQEAARWLQVYNSIMAKNARSAVYSFQVVEV